MEYMFALIKISIATYAQMGERLDFTSRDNGLFSYVLGKSDSR